MQIYGSTLVQGSQAMAGPSRSSASSGTAQPNSLATSSLSEVDQLDISPAGELASRSLEGPGRAERLAQIRAAIEAGTYETADKLNAAVDRLLGEIG